MRLGWHRASVFAFLLAPFLLAALATPAPAPNLGPHPTQYVPDVDPPPADRTANQARSEAAGAAEEAGEPAPDEAPDQSNDVSNLERAAKDTVGPPAPEPDPAPQPPSEPDHGPSIPGSLTLPDASIDVLGTLLPRPPGEPDVQPPTACGTAPPGADAGRRVVDRLAGLSLQPTGSWPGASNECAQASQPSESEDRSAVRSASSFGAIRPVGPVWTGITIAVLATVLVGSVLAGFTRLAPDEVLHHPRRARILEFVRGQPGVESSTVARALGLSWGPLVYHLGRLEHAGHLSVRRVGGRTALFAASAGYRGREEQLVLLRRATLRRLHELLGAHPGVDQAAIAVLLGISQPLVSRSLRRLTAANLVRSARAGRRRVYYPNAAAAVA